MPWNREPSSGSPERGTIVVTVVQPVAPSAEYWICTLLSASEGVLSPV